MKGGNVFQGNFFEREVFSNCQTLEAMKMFLWLLNLFWRIVFASSVFSRSGRVSFTYRLCEAVLSLLAVFGCLTLYYTIYFSKLNNFFVITFAHFQNRLISFRVRTYVCAPWSWIFTKRKRVKLGQFRFLVNVGYFIFGRCCGK